MEFDPRYTERHRIINPVSSPEKAKDKIEYIFDCPKCSPYRQRGDKPNKCRFPILEGHIMKCSRCWARILILDVQQSDLNPFDYLCSGVQIPSNKFNNINDPTARQEFEQLRKAFKYKLKNSKKHTYR